MLTATPIQNRLWDLYSLVDLLTVARGHENPFGSEGAFTRRFIADKRETARVLKPDAREDFRKIVYGYMSRVRRGDANLDFPERKIQLHKVAPSSEELELINAIAKPIQKLNRLSQISILQALTSSPHALMAQLQTMARNKTVPMELAATVQAIVVPMRTSAKLEGLRQLVEMLQQQNPTGWRMVVFTGRRETQTTIQSFLEGLGLKVGIINGSSGQRNQDTIARFRADPPEIRAIVSTEAGSEGVNLQIANVLINFDLPWNPMIVEQRIGRVQRLGSEHKNVVIYNVMLAGTFEEYIVGRLMTKLQMATDAIGDIESLLEASGVGDGEEGAGFDEKIRELVVAALAGRDMAAAAEKIARSIDAAKKTLEEEKANIDITLGAMDGYEYVGPQTPTLEKVRPSMEFEPFVRAAFANLGGTISEVAPGVLRVTIKGAPEYVRFREDAGVDYAKAPLYHPGSPSFLRLVDRVTASGLHQVHDADDEPRRKLEELACGWVADFGGNLLKVTVLGAQRRFEGNATARVRATTGHDSYERIVTIDCKPSDEVQAATALDSLPELLQQPEMVGADAARILDEALRDPNVVEFSRFYLERRENELRAAGSDVRKRKKLEDDFTPRIDATLVALDGQVSRRANLMVSYQLEGASYESELVISPSDGRIESAPALEQCALAHLIVPADCLATCALSGTRAMKHRLARSEVSGRYALPEHLLRCSLSGKPMLVDEAGMSDITNAVVDRTLLKKCAISGRKGEPAHFGTCAFTKADVLKEQLGQSEISGRPYRLDQEAISAFSGTRGHAQEFVRCQETRRLLLPREAERCAKTGKIVAPDVLRPCAVSGGRVLPNELRASSVSGKRVLPEHLVSSSVSDAVFLEEEGVRSAYGKFCAPVEAKRCQWSSAATHPDDIRTCALLGLAVHFQYLTDESRRLQPMEELLAGTRRTTDAHDRWDGLHPSVAGALKTSKCNIEAGKLSPDDGISRLL
ncbi:DEAD/DEAH box helicase [Bradyrhizobium sp. 190]|uniref:DEAD/DEAH box helicase n=1 Tax=Bradyrhizobium sp. 190 TaxID=2782658 RepID=UPI0020970493|nr:DEAD/DEAH box helicase [Bradyrhizobium sp. 190]